MSIKFAHEPDLRNSFPLRNGIEHPLLTIEETFKMQSYQKLDGIFTTSPWNPLQTVFAVWNRTEGRIRECWAAAERERVVSQLPPHLRHDMGDLDRRPEPPEPLAERLKSHQRTLETMWLRQLR